MTLMLVTNVLRGSWVNLPTLGILQVVEKWVLPTGDTQLHLLPLNTPGNHLVTCTATAQIEVIK